MKKLTLVKQSKPKPSRHIRCFSKGDMKKLIKKYVTTFPVAALGLALLGASMVHVEFNSNNGTREISGTPKEFEITLNNMKLDKTGRIHNQEDVFLRLSFDETNALEIGRGQKWNLSQGKQIDIDQKITLDNRFIKNDETKFTLELVHEQSVWGVSKADVTILRCNTVAKEISSFNRSYQCFVPGEKAAIITYRLAEKGVPPPSAQGDNAVAAN